jgi:hypothetical protein
MEKISNHLRTIRLQRGTYDQNNMRKPVPAQSATRNRSMNTKTLFSLVLRTRNESREVLHSDDLDVLRSCGTAIAPTTARDAELVLQSCRGRVIAEFDIWSSQWTAA